MVKQSDDTLAWGCGNRLRFAFRNEFSSDPRKFGRKRETEWKFGRGTESVFSQAINHRNWIRSSQIEGQKASYRSISRHWLTWVPFVTHWATLLILSAPLTMQALNMKTCATLLRTEGRAKSRGLPRKQLSARHTHFWRPLSVSLWKICFLHGSKFIRSHSLSRHSQHNQTILISTLGQQIKTRN